jgi:hypothetical protein
MPVMPEGLRRWMTAFLLCAGAVTLAACLINPQPEPPGSSDFAPGAGGGTGERDADQSAGTGGVADSDATSGGSSGTAGSGGWNGDAALSGDSQPADVPDAPDEDALDGGLEGDVLDAEPDVDLDADPCDGDADDPDADDAGEDGEAPDV